MSRRRSDPNVERPLHRQPGRPRGGRIFYVAVEGESAEPDYLDYLNERFGDEHDFFIQPLWRRHGFKPGEVVSKALELRSEGEVWAMFDRDEHPDIPQAMAAAKRGGVHVAFSHPSFDLWLLLHFTGFNSGRQNGSSKVVHEKLREHEGFETFGIDDKSVRGERADALFGKEWIAARNARKLADDCATPACSAAAGHANHCDPLKRDPSTGVGELLVALKIIKG